MRCDAGGSASVLLIGVLLPLAFFALCLSIDLGGYFLQLEALRSELDAVALGALRFMPDGPAVLAQAAQDLRRRGLRAEARLGGSSLELELLFRHQLGFAALLGIGDGL